MYPRLTSTIRRASMLAVATLIVGATGATAVAHASSVSATAGAEPAACEAMAEGTDAMAEGTDAMAEGTDAMAEGTDAMAEGTDAMAEGTDAMAEGTDAMAEGTDAMAEGTDAMAEGTDAMAEGTDAMAEGTDAMAEGTDAMADGGDLLTVADGAELSTFVAAIEAAGLADVLTDEGPVTVFAPDDEAFAAYLSETGTEEGDLLADTDALATLLSGHVVEGILTAEALVAADGLCLTTVGGTQLAVTVDGESITVGDATVLDDGATAANGVLYAIDQVITG